MFGSSWMETSPENEVICPDVKQVGKGTKKVKGQKGKKDGREDSAYFSQSQEEMMKTQEPLESRRLVEIKTHRK